MSVQFSSVQLRRYERAFTLTDSRAGQAGDRNSASLAADSPNDWLLFRPTAVITHTPTYTLISSPEGHLKGSVFESQKN